MSYYLINKDGRMIGRSEERIEGIRSIPDGTKADIHFMFGPLDGKVYRQVTPSRYFDASTGRYETRLLGNLWFAVFEQPQDAKPHLVVSKSGTVLGEVKACAEGTSLEGITLWKKGEEVEIVFVGGKLDRQVKKLALGPHFFYGNDRYEVRRAGKHWVASTANMARLADLETIALRAFNPDPVPNVMLDVYLNQRKKGMAQYGKPLEEAVGIDLHQYAMEELVDAFAYVHELKRRYDLLLAKLDEYWDIQPRWENGEWVVE